MESLIEVLVAVGGGFLAVFLFRFLKPNVKKQNNEVILKNGKIEKENQQLEKLIQSEKDKANKKLQDMEKEKEKDLSTEDLVDFFNNRK